MTRRRTLRLTSGNEPLRRVRGALRRRTGAVGTFSAQVLPRSDSARQFWSERAWSEYAAIPAMSQTVLASVRSNGSLDELGCLTLIAADEVRHTELSRQLADSLGGYVADLPDSLNFDPQSLADPNGTPLAYWIVGNGCVSETVSLELMRARLLRTTQPAVRALLNSVVKDEAVHARMAWMMAERLLPTLSQAERDRLAQYAEDLFSMVGRTFATCGLPREARRHARSVRRRTARLGLGACEPDEADAVCARAVTAVISPRLQRLGVPVFQGP